MTSGPNDWRTTVWATLQHAQSACERALSFLCLTKSSSKCNESSSESHLNFLGDSARLAAAPSGALGAAAARALGDSHAECEYGTVKPPANYPHTVT
jgi:hypothetical protein